MHSFFLLSKLYYLIEPETFSLCSITFLLEIEAKYRKIATLISAILGGNIINIRELLLKTYFQEAFPH
ncbi:hypothetical protein B9J77_02240 [candidate division NPL-UPA2 bacterium Unc8]|uniref:Uncharacterized protein n=1 Tax=candidate division NPL-UPA2 bacterium Unc8 TaxID=1980939 RepID=A0A399FWZ5_UNCN2|nr:MAG: hypothetical protein B9J77_02240 [candidate division NPL-UPA2 bacterium Unc8]